MEIQINWNQLTNLKYTAKSVDKMASSNTLMTLEYSSGEILDNNWLPGEFKIMIHWSKWWCSIVDVEYNWARGDEALKSKFTNKSKFYLKFSNTYLIWNELLVPLWSKSWQRHAIIKARHSISPNMFHHWVVWIENKQKTIKIFSVVCEAVFLPLK